MRLFFPKKERTKGIKILYMHVAIRLVPIWKINPMPMLRERPKGYKESYKRKQTPKEKPFRWVRNHKIIQQKITLDYTIRNNSSLKLNQSKITH